MFHTYRQFPGMFQPREVKRGKGRFVTPARSPAPVKNFNLTVYALGRPANITPKGSKDLELSRAGLGKRLITVPEDNNHSEVFIVNYCLQLKIPFYLIHC